MDYYLLLLKHNMLPHCAVIPIRHCSVLLIYLHHADPIKDHYDTTAAYLVDDCQLVSHAGRRRLRSADIDTCCVPRTNTRFGDRSFAAAGPRLWSSLPAKICQPDNDSGEFRRQLKSFLFKWHRGANSITWTWILILINHRVYVLALAMMSLVPTSSV